MGNCKHEIVVIPLISLCLGVRPSAEPHTNLEFYSRGSSARAFVRDTLLDGFVLFLFSFFVRWRIPLHNLHLATTFIIAHITTTITHSSSIGLRIFCFLRILLHDRASDDVTVCALVIEHTRAIKDSSFPFLPLFCLIAISLCLVHFVVYRWE